MKLLKYSMLFLFTAVLMGSCSNDDDNTPKNIEEMEDLKLVKTFTDKGYTVELFNKTGQFEVGYNKVYLRLTDNNGNYVQQASLDWMPMMTMNMGDMTHHHSCPFSNITKVDGKQTLFEAYIVFIMASDEPDNFWELTLNFTVNGQNYEVSDKISVLPSESDYRKIYTSGMASDSTMYMLALVEPSEPKIGTNDIVVGLFKMGENGNFPIVDNYLIKVDPRMPAMGNHTAPGNVDMTQGDEGFYHGKVGFSMSGYWKINMILENDLGTVIKGEPVTESNPESSLNFKLEF